MTIINYTTHPIFEADQVLTSSHLNDLFNYLEEQERLTRVKLIGSGVVCGLDAYIGAKNGNDAVVISKGVGVTSKGFLVALENEQDELTGLDVESDVNKYPFYTEFKDAINLEDAILSNDTMYSFFDNEGTQIPLYELHAQNVISSQTLDNLIDEEEGIPLSEYCVMLYVECFDRQLKNCIENDCNEKGVERNYTLRKLLISKANLEEIIRKEEEGLSNEASINDIDGFFNARYYLEPFQIPRLKMSNPNIFSVGQLAGIYQETIAKSINAIHPKLSKSIGFLYPILFKDFPDVGALHSMANAFLNKFNGLLTETNPCYLQYIYDALFDIVEAHNELVHYAFDVVSECCPPLDRFPKHIRLGHLGSPVKCTPSPYRTGFTASPIHNHGHEGKQKVMALYKRLELMIKTFELPIGLKEIKVTPSVTLADNLSKKPIPYYYNLSKPLIKTWNYDLGRKCREKENLSYNANQFASRGVGTPPDYVLNPLDYGITPYDFFRVEGHICKNYRGVLENLISIRNNNNLPFDVIALKLGSDATGTTFDDAKCNFKDLEILCEAWKSELQCLLSKVTFRLSRINLKETIVAKVKIDDAATGTGTAVTGATGTVKTVKTIKPVGLGGREFRVIDESASKLAEFRRGTPTFDASKYSLESKASLQKKVFTPRVFDGVVGQIEKDNEETLGFVLNTAMKEESEICKYDVAGSQILHTQLIKYENYQLLDKTDDLIAFQYPMELLVSILDFSKVIDKDCHDLDMEELEKKIQEMNRRASRYLAGLNNYGKTNLADRRINVDFQAMIQLTTVLTTNCSFETLKELMREMESRKAEILQMNLFAEYLKKNRGMDHRAGVPKGGTFVLVYADDTVVADSGKVVADFYLPYLCCSDCPPVTYVFTDKDETVPPDEKVELNITNKNFCKPTTANPHKFIVTPADGVVSGEGVVGNVANGFAFDANKVNLGSSISKALTFKVNGKDVPLSVRVNQMPDASFKITDTDWRLEGTTNLRYFLYVNVEITKYESQFDYIWKIVLDGEKEIYHKKHTEIPGGKNLQQFKFSTDQVKPGMKFSVSLDAVNGNCKDDATEAFMVSEIPKEVPVEFQLLVNGKAVKSPYSFQNTLDGQVRINAKPKGKFEVGTDFKKLGLKQVGETDKFTNYVFSPINKPKGEYLLNYKTETGNEKLKISITQTVFGDFRSVVDLRNISSDPKIVEVLGTDSEGLRNSIGVAASLAARTSHPVLSRTIARGAFNKDFSDTLLPALKDVKSKVVSSNTSSAKNTQKQNILLGVYEKQVAILLQMVVAQGKDISGQSPLSKMITQVNKQLKDMKGAGVKINVGKRIQKQLVEAEKKLIGKPIASKRFKELIKTVKS